MVSIAEMLEQVEEALDEIVEKGLQLLSKVCEWLRDIEHDVPFMTSKERSIYRSLWQRVHEIHSITVVNVGLQSKAAIA